MFLDKPINGHGYNSFQIKCKKYEEITNTNIGKFKGDSKLYSWMFRIATNESLTFIEQRAKKQGISNVELQQKAILHSQTQT